MNTLQWGLQQHASSSRRLLFLEDGIGSSTFHICSPIAQRQGAYCRKANCVARDVMQVYKYLSGLSRPVPFASPHCDP